MQRFRLTPGGVLDRTQPLTFHFDGARLQGFAGDTLASALLANGVHLVGRSFKYHRPRGIMCAGTDEPNALVQLGAGARSEPNVRATTQELHDGLIASSQNCWPSVRFDVGAWGDALSRMIPAGFYYKTFMWPAHPRWWLRYEHAIRRAAGMGRAPAGPDPDHYGQRFAHCDVLVIGGGVTGLAAARAAAATGARVIVCEEQPSWGGRLIGARGTIDGLAIAAWVDGILRELASTPEVTLLSRTTAVGYYDGSLVAAVERLTDHQHDPPSAMPRQRLWKIRAHRVVLAGGAIERPIPYAGNDVPGTMLADAARTYVERYAVIPGSSAVVFTNNDAAYAAALALHDAGTSVRAIVDVRTGASRGTLPQRALAAGLPVLAGCAVAAAYGKRRVRAVDVVDLARGTRHRLDCDLVCVSGGFNPAIHLFSQARGKLCYDDSLATFVPATCPMPIQAAGGAKGVFDLAAALVDGAAAGTLAATRAGFAASSRAAPNAERAKSEPLRAIWSVPSSRKGAKRFVDLQNDVTVSDIALAAREGYGAIEHLKRYTTLGMGTDQGKTSNVIGLALLADQLGVPIERVGTTTFRPPYTPVTLGAIPGHEQGADIEPTRRSAMHDWHAQRGARFVNAGLWKRPHSYPRAGESEDDAANREARNVRVHAGIVDVSTLGKIELQGHDVVEFLNRVYINRWDSLAVGRCRYGVMLREDGMVLDDGTLSRLADTHYLITTTTVNAVKVMQQLEYLLQVEWPDLEVFATSVTEQWAAAAISGPRARDIVASVVDIDVSNAAFPFLAVAGCTLRAGAERMPARLFRMSYSGELAYEVHVAANRGLRMWEAMIAAGEPFGIMPYGTEAMSTLRIEKGHIVVGPEADGRTTADDLGLGKLVNAGKWCIGKPLLGRGALTGPGRWQLVGLTALDASPVLRGAKLVADPDRAPPNPMQGQVTSWCFSPNLDAWIALALLADGRARHGETLWAVSPLAGARTRVKVGSPCFLDPDGERLRG